MYQYQYKLHNLDESVKASILGKSLFFVPLRAWTSGELIMTAMVHWCRKTSVTLENFVMVDTQVV
jgi:hypothetical protein